MPRHWLREEWEGLCKVPRHWLREEGEGLCKVPRHWLREEGEGLCKVPRHCLTLQSLATASGWKGVFRAERYCKRNTNTCMVIHPHTNTTPAHMHIYAVTYIHTCIQKIRSTHSYRLAHIHTYTLTHTHTHIHTHTHTRIRTHTSIQANTRTPSLYLKDVSKEGHFWLGEHVKVMHHGPSLGQQGGVGGGVGRRRRCEQRVMKGCSNQWMQCILVRTYLLRVAVERVHLVEGDVSASVQPNHLLIRNRRVTPGGRHVWSRHTQLVEHGHIP